MAIVTNYNFKGIEVKDAIIRVKRIFGSSKEGWDSLVQVYNQNIEIDTNIAKENIIEEFNFKAPFKEDERGYKTIYDALMAKFGGVEI